MRKEEEELFEVPPEIANLLSHQDLLLDVNCNNFIQISKKLLSSDYFDSSRGVYLIATNILNIVKYRPKNHYAYTLLIRQLINHQDESNSNRKYYHLLKPYILSAFRAIVDNVQSYPDDMGIISFMYDLYTSQCFSIQEITDMINLVFKTHFNPTESAIVLFFYFAPELSGFDKESFNHILDIVINSEERTFPQEISDMFVLIDDLFANNFQMLRGWRKCHAVPDCYADAIMRDDPAMLQAIISKENGTVNEPVPPFIFGLSSFVNFTPSLLQYSAFFSALDCFKFLLSRNANLSYSDGKNRTLVQFAIAGGCSEIINILEQREILFSRTLDISIEFHHADLFKWLLKNKYSDKLMEDALPIQADLIAYRSNNAHILDFCMRRKIRMKTDLFSSWESLWHALANGFFVTYQLFFPKRLINIHPTGSDCHYTILHWAVKNKYQGLIEEILSLKNMDINAKDDYGRTPFYIASENGYLDILNTLQKHGAEINRRAKNNLLPIHAAIRNNQDTVIQFLINETDIDLNMKDSSFIFLFILLIFFIWEFFFF